MTKKFPFFGIYAADELSDLRKTGWNQAQWCAWIRLKLSFWISETRGYLANDDKWLQEIALWPANGDSARWKAMKKFFKVDGKFLCDPDLISSAKKLTGEAKDYSVAGQISALSRKLMYLPKDSPERPHLEEELAKMRSKTARGKSAARASASKSPAPANAKPAPASGKIVFEGVNYFPGELQRLKAQLIAQIAENKKTKPPAPASGTPADSQSNITYRVRLAEWNEEQRRLKARRDEIDVALGLRPAKPGQVATMPPLPAELNLMPAPSTATSAAPDGEKKVPLIFSPEFKANLGRENVLTPETKTPNERRNSRSARTAKNAGGLNPVAKLAREKRKGKTLEQITS